MTRLSLCLVLAGGLAAATPTVSAQARRGLDPQQQPPQAQAGISPAEIQRMFDASALLQAQEQLQIRDDQFPQFLSRFKALQDLRRQALIDRMQILQQLRRVLNASAASGAAGSPDETAVRDRLKLLQDLDAKQVADVAKAYESIDQVLDIRQRAQLRIFEEVMERQKLELVMRARQANRPARQF